MIRVPGMELDERAKRKKNGRLMLKQKYMGNTNFHATSDGMSKCKVLRPRTNCCDCVAKTGKVFLFARTSVTYLFFLCILTLGLGYRWKYPLVYTVFIFTMKMEVLRLCHVLWNLFIRSLDYGGPLLGKITVLGGEWRLSRSSMTSLGCLRYPPPLESHIQSISESCKSCWR